MRMIFALPIGVCCFSHVGYADTYVEGYFRKDGTYVPPHYRTAPDHNIYNNYSTKPNVNPYTGERGTVDPYKVPSYGTYNPYYGTNRRW